MRKSRRSSSRPHKKKHNNIKKYHEAYSLRFDDRILLANEQSPSTRMHSTQKIDSSAFTGSRLSTHRSSGKTASISKKIRANDASLPAAAETFLARETRQEETTSTTRNKVASRFYLQRERDLSFEQIRRKRVRFFGRVSRLLVRFRAQWFIFSFSSNKPPHFICFRFV